MFGTIGYVKVLEGYQQKLGLKHDEVGGVESTKLVGVVFVCHYFHLFPYVYNWLVVWNMFHFPFHIWDIILPID